MKNKQNDCRKVEMKLKVFYLFCIKEDETEDKKARVLKKGLIKIR